ASVEVLGQDARAFAKRVEAVQEALGEHQDSVVARARLRELGVVAHLAGENAFTFGLLYGLEAGRADRTEEAFDALWPALAGKHSRWLR
ncbi:MAG: CHAD domain-containing protein, partial [Actinomycetota bacterium]|nr:CHAD domain-containing protein [Actinomycetota bacterium]